MWCDETVVPDLHVVKHGESISVRRPGRRGQEQLLSTEKGLREADHLEAARSQERAMCKRGREHNGRGGGCAAGGQSTDEWAGWFRFGVGENQQGQDSGRRSAVGGRRRVGEGKQASWVKSDNQLVETWQRP